MLIPQELQLSLLLEREGKECTTNKKGVSGWPFLLAL